MIVICDNIIEEAKRVYKQKIGEADGAWEICCDSTVVSSYKDAANLEIAWDLAVQQLRTGIPVVTLLTEEQIRRKARNITVANLVNEVVNKTQDVAGIVEIKSDTVTNSESNDNGTWGKDVGWSENEYSDFDKAIIAEAGENGMDLEKLKSMQLNLCLSVLCIKDCLDKYTRGAFYTLERIGKNLFLINDEYRVEGEKIDKCFEMFVDF